MKVLTVIGTRPEIIRLSRIIATLDEYVEHVVVHTGQNYDYELSQIFFDDLSLRKPDYFLDAAGATPAPTVPNPSTATPICFIAVLLWFPHIIQKKRGGWQCAIRPSPNLARDLV